MILPVYLDRQHQQLCHQALGLVLLAFQVEDLQRFVCPKVCLGLHCARLERSYGGSLHLKPIFKLYNRKMQTIFTNYALMH